MLMIGKIILIMILNGLILMLGIIFVEQIVCLIVLTNDSNLDLILILE